MTVLEIIGQVLIVLGALIYATAALGLMRFFDAFSRISAVGTAGGLGISFVVVGALLLQPAIPDVVKVALSIIFQFATSAVGTMALARSAYLVGTPLERASFDELADDSGDVLDEHAVLTESIQLPEQRRPVWPDELRDDAQ